MSFKLIRTLPLLTQKVRNVTHSSNVYDSVLPSSHVYDPSMQNVLRRSRSLVGQKGSQYGVVKRSLSTPPTGRMGKSMVVNDGSFKGLNQSGNGAEIERGRFSIGTQRRNMGFLNNFFGSSESKCPVPITCNRKVDKNGKVSIIFDKYDFKNPPNKKKYDSVGCSKSSLSSTKNCKLEMDVQQVTYQNELCKTRKKEEENSFDFYKLETVCRPESSTCDAAGMIGPKIPSSYVKIEPLCAEERRCIMNKEQPYKFDYDSWKVEPLCKTKVDALCQEKKKVDPLCAGKTEDKKIAKAAPERQIQRKKIAENKPAKKEKFVIPYKFDYESWKIKRVSKKTQPAPKEEAVWKKVDNCKAPYKFDYDSWRDLRQKKKVEPMCADTEKCAMKKEATCAAPCNLKHDSLEEKNEVMNVKPICAEKGNDPLEQEKSAALQKFDCNERIEAKKIKSLCAEKSVAKKENESISDSYKRDDFFAVPYTCDAWKTVMNIIEPLCATQDNNNNFKYENNSGNRQSETKKAISAEKKTDTLKKAVMNIVPYEFDYTPNKSKSQTSKIVPLCAEKLKDNLKAEAAIQPMCAEKQMAHLKKEESSVVPYKFDFASWERKRKRKFEIEKNLKKQEMGLVPYKSEEKSALIPTTGMFNIFSSLAKFFTSQVKETKLALSPGVVKKEETSRNIKSETYKEPEPLCFTKYERNDTNIKRETIKEVKEPERKCVKNNNRDDVVKSEKVDDAVKECPDDNEGIVLCSTTKRYLIKYTVHHQNFDCNEDPCPKLPFNECDCPDGVRKKDHEIKKLCQKRPTTEIQNANKGEIEGKGIARLSEIAPPAITEPKCEQQCEQREPTITPSVMKDPESGPKSPKVDPKDNFEIREPKVNQTKICRRRRDDCDWGGNSKSKKGKKCDDKKSPDKGAECRRCDKFKDEEEVKRKPVSCCQPKIEAPVCVPPPVCCARQKPKASKNCCPAQPRKPDPLCPPKCKVKSKPKCCDTVEPCPQPNVCCHEMDEDIRYKEPCVEDVLASEDKPDRPCVTKPPCKKKVKKSPPLCPSRMEHTNWTPVPLSRSCGKCKTTKFSKSYAKAKAGCAATNRLRSPNLKRRLPKPPVVKKGFLDGLKGLYKSAMMSLPGQGKKGGDKKAAPLPLCKTPPLYLYKLPEMGEDGKLKRADEVWPFLLKKTEEECECEREENDIPDDCEDTCQKKPKSKPPKLCDD